MYVAPTAQKMCIRDSVLTGDVNPSGKLPFTFPAKLEDVPAHQLGQYPGNEKVGNIVNEKYNEGIFVGYRWTDKQKKVKPLFPFGYGLSYTTFEYGKPVADKKTMSADDTITFTVSVKNTGTREGQEVVQLLSLIHILHSILSKTLIAKI